MKPDEKAEIPVGVVIGSILAGLLLLLALVAILWKVSRCLYSSKEKQKGRNTFGLFSLEYLFSEADRKCTCSSVVIIILHWHFGLDWST